MDKCGDCEFKGRLFRHACRRRKCWTLKDYWKDYKLEWDRFTDCCRRVDSNDWRGWLASAKRFFRWLPSRRKWEVLKDGPHPQVIDIIERIHGPIRPGISFSAIDHLKCKFHYALRRMREWRLRRASERFHLKWMTQAGRRQEALDSLAKWRKERER